MKKRFLYLAVLAAVFLIVPIRASAEDTTEESISGPEIVTDASGDSGKKVTWNCVWFGYYPQKEVTVNSVLYKKLEKSKNWSEKGDLKKAGVRYHRMKQSDALLVSSGKNYYSWKGKNSWRYFIYQPVKWRILSVENGQALLLSDQILDCRTMNEQSGKVSETNSWVSGTLRSWLNGYSEEANKSGISYTEDNFRSRAFSKAEQALIFGTARKMETAGRDGIGTLSITQSDTVSDSVYLLMLSEIYGTEGKKHGFYLNDSLQDPASAAFVSDYARARGAWSQKTGKKFAGIWWLSTETGSPGSVCWTDAAGKIHTEGLPSSLAGAGVRPALTLNVSVSGNYSFAGTVSSDGIVKEPEKQETKISCAKSSYSVTPGTGSFSLQAVLLTGDGKLKYSSDNAKVASVSGSGKVTVRDYGKAGIHIHAEETAYYQAADKTIKIEVVPKQRKITSIKSPSSQKLAVTWKRDKDVSGYHMQVSKTANFSKETAERYYTKGKTKASLEGLQPGKTYYVRIRAYKKVKKEVLYGKWSKVKSAKIK